jgi:hypothetical protein
MKGGFFVMSGVPWREAGYVLYNSSPSILTNDGWFLDGGNGKKLQ